MALDTQDKQWISEQLETLATRLLAEFHKWASPSDARARARAAAIHALNVEVE